MLIAVPAINLLSHLNQQLVLPSALHGLEEWMRQMEDAAAVEGAERLALTTDSYVVQPSVFPGRRL